MIKRIINYIFPEKDICYFCRLEKTSKGEYLCKDCISKFKILNKEFIIENDYIDKIYYVTLYNRFIKEIIKDFKFNEKSYLYKPISQMLYNLLVELDLKEVDYITYVPSSLKKECIRGYNQSKLMAYRLSYLTNIPVKEIIVKIKNTKEQNKLSKDKRETNLKDAFKLVSKCDLKNKNILIVDDLVTTGQTIIECSKEIKKSGCSKIIGIAFASPSK